jgi:hypothetical protein
MQHAAMKQVARPTCLLAFECNDVMFYYYMMLYYLKIGLVGWPAMILSIYLSIAWPL